MTTHSIWLVLKEQGRSKAWLARKTGYTPGYVRAIACGYFDTSPEFRRRCADALDLPESVLFVGESGVVRPRGSSVA